MARDIRREMLNRFRTAITEGKVIAFLCHASPDPDGWAALQILRMIVWKLGGTCRLFYAGEEGRVRRSELGAEPLAKLVELGEQDPHGVYVVLVDCYNVHGLNVRGKLDSSLLLPKPSAVIDHHGESEDYVDCVQWIDTAATSSTVMSLELAEVLFGEGEGVGTFWAEDLGRQLATFCYVGIVTDCGKEVVGPSALKPTQAVELLPARAGRWVSQLAPHLDQALLHRVGALSPKLDQAFAHIEVAANCDSRPLLDGGNVLSYWVGRIGREQHVLAQVADSLKCRTALSGVVTVCGVMDELQPPQVRMVIRRGEGSTLNLGEVAKAVFGTNTKGEYLGGGREDASAGSWELSTAVSADQLIMSGREKWGALTERAASVVNMMNAPAIAA